jgi:hypothetical protein
VLSFLHDFEGSVLEEQEPSELPKQSGRRREERKAIYWYMQVVGRRLKLLQSKSTRGLPTLS